MKQLLAMAEIAAHHVDEMLSQKQADLQTIAILGTIDLEDSNLEPEKEMLHNLYQEGKGGIERLFLTDASGFVLWVEPNGGSVAGSRIYNYPAVGKSIETGEPQMATSTESNILVQPLSQIISVPLFGRDGSLGGLLVAAVDPSTFLSAFTETTRLGKTGYVELIDQDGIVISRTMPERSPSTLERSDHADRFKVLITEQRAGVRTCHVCHSDPSGQQKRKDVMAFAPLATAPWGLAIRQSEAEAFALVNGLRRSLLLLVSISIPVALSLLWVTTESVRRPIRMLMAASRRIANGDLTTEIPKVGKDEVGTLAQSLNEMRASLKASRADIEEWNRELETKVQLRTKELATLMEVLKSLTAITNLEEHMDAITAKVVAVIEPADASILLLYEAEADRLVARSAYGFDNGYCPPLVLKPDEGIPGQAFRSGQAALYSNSEAIAEAWENRPTELLRREPQSAVCVPLLLQNRVIGVILLFSHQTKDALSQSDLGLIRAVADEVVIVLENSRLSQQAKQVRALQEADRLRSEFISTISHELRTPLTSIKGYATTLLRPDVKWDGQDAQEFLQIIDEESDELEGLINNLLESSQLEAGVLRLNKEPILVAPLTRRVAEGWAPRSKNHQILMELPSHIPVVEADPHHLERILHNLVENAVKYSSPGTPITIRAKVEGGTIVMSVSDQGYGIPSQDLERIFEKFYRVEQPSTRRTGGTGLGLFIVRRLVQANGGQVWAESEIGKGSTFYFTIPIPSQAVSIEEDP
ncbi:MAG: GAF domain-containing protein [Chloroflexi bacterium]|nr:GAF domain-containing protein [Chloroflexota bacterium]